MLNVTNPSADFVVTSIAATAVAKYLKENDAPPGSGLRLGVRGGGCSGLSYVLEAGIQREKDHVFQKEGQEVFIDPKSMAFLQGCTLDFMKGLMESGFKISNPQEKRSCGCGESFSV